MSYITANVKRIITELSPGTTLVTVVKGRTPEEIQEAVAAGATILGENYLQEAEQAWGMIGKQVQWHFIGHLQRNKVKKAVKIFDMVETVDSLALARDIDTVGAANGRTMPVLIEVNSGREKQKSGLLPEAVPLVVNGISGLKHLKLVGLMTMGPRVGDPEEARPYFQTTRRLFQEIQASSIPNVEMKYLSMGMSNSYRIALQEGANMIRIGRQIFEKNTG
jgi:PLP dependent protein